MTNFLVFCEVANGSVRGSARELLGKASELAGGGAVTAVVIGADVAGAASGLGALGAHKVISVEDASLGYYVPTSFAAAPVPGGCSGKPRRGARLGFGVG